MFRALLVRLGQRPQCFFIFTKINILQIHFYHIFDNNRVKPPLHPPLSILRNEYPQICIKFNLYSDQSKSYKSPPLGTPLRHRVMGFVLRTRDRWIIRLVHQIDCAYVFPAGLLFCASPPLIPNVISTSLRIRSTLVNYSNGWLMLITLMLSSALNRRLSIILKGILK